MDNKEILLAFFFLVVLCILFRRNENFTNHASVPIFGYQTNPSKCFSCEKQFNPNEAWMGQPSKCFDCERQFGKLPWRK